MTKQMTCPFCASTISVSEITEMCPRCGHTIHPQFNEAEQTVIQQEKRQQEIKRAAELKNNNEITVQKKGDIASLVAGSLFGLAGVAGVSLWRKANSIEDYSNKTTTFVPDKWKVCPKCGKENAPQRTDCLYCNTPLDAPPPAPMTTVMPPVSQPVTSATGTLRDPEPQPTENPSDRRFCPYCGSAIYLQDEFCFKCGKKMAWDKTENSLR